MRIALAEKAVDEKRAAERVEAERIAAESARRAELIRQEEARVRALHRAAITWTERNEFGGCSRRLETPRSRTVRQLDPARPLATGWSGQHTKPTGSIP